MPALNPAGARDQIECHTNDKVDAPLSSWLSSSVRRLFAFLRRVCRDGSRHVRTLRPRSKKYGERLQTRRNLAASKAQPRHILSSEDGLRRCQWALTSDVLAFVCVLKRQVFTSSRLQVANSITPSHAIAVSFTCDYCSFAQKSAFEMPECGMPSWTNKQTSPVPKHSSGCGGNGSLRAATLLRSNSSSS